MYRPVVSNCCYYTKNISAFLDFHMQPLGQAVKSCIKDTNYYRKLPGNIILHTVDVLCLYLNIPHEEGLSALLGNDYITEW